MTRSKRMDPVVQVAESRERDAARQLGEWQGRLAQHEARLAELLSYRDDYARQFESTGGNGLGAQRLQDYRAFLERLNSAVRQQEDVLAHTRGEIARLRSRWLDKRTHAKALDKVVERYREDERRAAERREQNESDERANRLSHPANKPQD